MRVCLWSIVVNSENSDPAKNKRADLPAAGKFTRGQKKKIPKMMPVLTIDRYVRFFFFFFFLADLSYVGFVLVSDFLDISDGRSISLFVSQNKSSPMDLFLS
jgi:hypothetical protein